VNKGKESVLAKGLYMRVRKCKTQHWLLSTRHDFTNFSWVCTSDFLYRLHFLTHLILHWLDTSYSIKFMMTISPPLSFQH